MAFYSTIKRFFVALSINKKALLSSLLYVLIFGYCGIAFADSTTSSALFIEDEAEVNITYDMYVFKGDNYHWKDIAQKPLSEGKLNRGGFFNVDEFGTPLWVRLDITTGQLDPIDKWLLGLGNGFGGDMVLYIIADGKVIQETVLSSKEKFSERPHKNRFVHFPLSLPSHKNVELLIKINSVSIPFFIPSLTTENLLKNSETQQGIFLGFAFGLLVTLMIYHLILSLATLEKSYLLYSLHLASACFWLSIYNGLGFKFFWPEHPWIEKNLSILMFYSPVLTSILFTMHFLKLPSISKTFTYFYAAVFAWLLGLIIVRFFTPTINITWMSITTLFIYLSFIYSGLFALKKGVIYAKYFLLAWTIYCLAIINFMLVASRQVAFFQEYSYHMVLIAFDIQVMLLAAELAHRIRTLSTSKLEAEADNRAKSEFLARMSHEIRTPLSGVLGMAELLADRLTDKTNIYYTNIIRSSGNSLLTVINDILDYSKFSSGKMEFEKIPFSLQRLAVDSLDIFKVKAAEKHIELIADVNLDIPEFVIGDPTRVKQVMLNFISNAIKFTNEGQIILNISPVANQDDMIKISVSDSGEGISEENQKKLFEAFTQANESTSRKHGGTGLGLSICKQLAHLMGGEIGVESTINKGSTFWITVNLPKGESDTATVNLSDFSLQNINLLIVEDNYTFSELLQTQANTWGMTCSVARNGYEALKILEQQYDQGIHFDLISLDLFMPKMDGLETGKRIQADGRFSSIPRLLLTSATDFPPQHALASAGINRVMEKPTLPSSLQEIYKELLAKDDGTRDETNQDILSEKIPLPQLSILIAEDNPVNQIVIKGILSRLNQTITIVDDGQKALDAIKESTDQFDLILMDYDMPVMDGKTATLEIRKWEKENNRPSIFITALTAHVVQNQIDECFAVGMNQYLAKPIDIEKLEELIRSFPNQASE
ncbi:MAG: response regulator [Cellvibrionaceae bacterium]